MNIKPKLLSPAGSFDALRAAIDAGADEVYFGAAKFNARENAENFDERTFADGLKLCSVYNVASNITLNTLLFDREINEALSLARFAAENNASSFIVQDIGYASLLAKLFPDVKLCASTQACAHSFDGAMKLNKLGFKRIVLARELTKENIKEITERAEDVFECEIFAHGALCVCHSGQCLMSSVIGARSGNRGMCAQPCRMRYSLDKKDGYPLSLKDLTLCRHITDILELGVSALKIEGRMKSGEYVYNVTRIFRKLIDEERNATDEEYSYLCDLFSRDGFTDSYFTGKYTVKNRDMYGTRLEASKEKTRILENETKRAERKIKIGAKCEICEGKFPTLSLYCENKSVSISSDTPAQKAVKCPTDEETVERSIKKLGDTPFVLDDEKIEIILDSHSFVAVSKLNELRRLAANALYEKLTLCGRKYERTEYFPAHAKTVHTEKRARIYPERIDAELIEKYVKAKGELPLESAIFPLYEFSELDEDKKRTLEKLGCRLGVAMPRVLSDREKKNAVTALENAKAFGAEICEISNVGQIETAKEFGFTVYAGLTMNVTNSETAKVLRENGVSSVFFSPELSFSQIRDIEKGVSDAVFVYGRLPLMTLESCVKKANLGCEGCKNGSVISKLHDRTNADFPILCAKRFDIQSACRNVIFNSVVHDRRTRACDGCGAGIYCFMGLI